MRDDIGRFPVSDYDSALRWLWNYSRPADWLDGDEDYLPLEAVLVCDLFWISRRQLLADVREDWNLTLAGKRPQRFRGRLSW